MVLARLRSLFRSWKEVRDLTRESPERLQALIKQNEAAAAASEQRLANMQQSLARPLEQVEAARSSEFVVAKRQGNPTGLFVGRCPACTPLRKRTQPTLTPTLQVEAISAQMAMKGHAEAAKLAEGAAAQFEGMKLDVYAMQQKVRHSRAGSEMCPCRQCTRRVTLSQA